MLTRHSRYNKTLALAGLLSLMSLSCGGTEADRRPVEILYFVQGPTNAEFEIVDQEGNSDCTAPSREGVPRQIPSQGFGIQSNDATHTLTGTFRAPHFFVVENEQQPSRIVIRNLADDGSELTVRRLFGFGTLDTLSIPAGECRSFSNFPDARESSVEDNGDFVMTPPGQEFRVEVCSLAIGAVIPPDFLCQQLREDGNAVRDAGASFEGSFGDFAASFLTSCLQIEPTEQINCRTPSTFYLNRPQDQISASLTLLPRQNDVVLQADLYRGGVLLDTSRDAPSVSVVRDI